jgi:hypothetical protein
MAKRIPYGIGNYAELVEKNCYFVDKTPYIALLEGVQNPVYLRPRRFGKSLFCSLLRWYYDMNVAPRFAELFGNTWIGQQPTGNQNRYMVLGLNFSTIVAGPTLQDIEESFKLQVNNNLQQLKLTYPTPLVTMPEIDLGRPVADNLTVFLDYIQQNGLPPLYITIDEYDNFANQLITGNRDYLYHLLTADESFFKSFFKSLKKGREIGSIANTYITGVLPILIDDLASGYNIAKFLTLNPRFEAMVGFTQAETTTLLNAVYEEYALAPESREEVDALLKNYYNGYHFADLNGEALYNSTSLMYFLDELTQHSAIPKRLIDVNLKTDISWVRRLTASNPALTEEFVDQVTIHNTIGYDESFLVEKFDMHQFFEKGFFPISFFYLGMLTRRDDFYMKLPNVNMRQIFVEYFNEIHHIDVSTRYSAIMQTFINQPNLEYLFAGYWREYVGQLPEAVFRQMNENFYRTTFYELCSRYLSRWFTWNLERSYPQGQSDLEFVGKFHERYAGLRWVIEFKYYSNAEFKKLNTTIEAFEGKAEDTEQITGYVQGLRQEYPEARIEKFVIYCFGNQGFRVFAV